MGYCLLEEVGQVCLILNDLGGRTMTVQTWRPDYLSGMQICIQEWIQAASCFRQQEVTVGVYFT